MRPEDLAESIPAGPDPKLHLDAIRKAVETGFDHVVLTGIGPDQERGRPVLRTSIEAGAFVIAGRTAGPAGGEMSGFRGDGMHNPAQGRRDCEDGSMACGIVRFRWGMAAIAMASALVGCSPSSDAGPETDAAPSSAAATLTPVPSHAAPAAVATASAVPVGGTGTALDPLSSVEVDAAGLQGELACSFETARGQALLVAQGDVASRAPAQAVVKVAGRVEPVGTPGGFDAMVDGARFAGKGLAVVIAVTGKPRGNAESPPVAATATLERANGTRTRIAGDWICGP